MFFLQLLICLYMFRQFFYASGNGFVSLLVSSGRMTCIALSLFVSSNMILFEKRGKLYRKDIFQEGVRT
ncbi:hypothetical protein JOD01_000646 [Brevibacillus fulvus]|uniref:Uncharacterized protein n=1 Tax=Brevibacillus fulvus TaxID=1125967 RepID=A0A938Y0T4_9BACL|nr:hypothetical protein [Brevibacillus fulvus]